MPSSRRRQVWSRVTLSTWFTFGLSSGKLAEARAIDVIHLRWDLTRSDLHKLNSAHVCHVIN
jgi:hypothetical protein